MGRDPAGSSNPAQTPQKSHSVHSWENCPGALAALGMSPFNGDPVQFPILFPINLFPISTLTLGCAGFAFRDPPRAPLSPQLFPLKRPVPLPCSFPPSPSSPREPAGLQEGFFSLLSGKPSRFFPPQVDVLLPSSAEGILRHKREPGKKTPRKKMDFNGEIRPHNWEFQ